MTHFMSVRRLQSIVFVWLLLESSAEAGRQARHLKGVWRRYKQYRLRRYSRQCRDKRPCRLWVRSANSVLAQLTDVIVLVLVSGWSDNGWLSGGQLHGAPRHLIQDFYFYFYSPGHAVRMALELGMNKAWPRLLHRINANKMSTTKEERELVISARTWFCLYLFEHQYVQSPTLHHPSNEDVIGCLMALVGPPYCASMNPLGIVGFC